MLPCLTGTVVAGPAAALRTGLAGPRSEEVDALLGPVDEPDVDLAEVVLREFPGQPLEADHRFRFLLAHRADQLVERALATGIPRELCPAEHFERQQLGLALE